MKNYKLLILALIFHLVISSIRGESLKIAFWNVENLFDLEDDPHTNDNDFALGG